MRYEVEVIRGKVEVGKPASSDLLLGRDRGDSEDFERADLLGFCPLFRRELGREPDVIDAALAEIARPPLFPGRERRFRAQNWKTNKQFFILKIVFLLRMF